MALTTSDAPLRPQPCIAEHNVKNRIIWASRDVDAHVQAVAARNKIAKTGTTRVHRLFARGIVDGAARGTCTGEAQHSILYLS